MADDAPADFTLDVCMVCGGVAHGIQDMGYSCAGGICSTCFDGGLITVPCPKCRYVLPVFYYHKNGKKPRCPRCAED